MKYFVSCIIETIEEIYDKILILKELITIIYYSMMDENVVVAKAEKPPRVLKTMKCWSEAIQKRF